jgi:hypothetical protein
MEHRRFPAIYHLPFYIFHRGYAAAAHGRRAHNGVDRSNIKPINSSE